MEQDCHICKIALNLEDHYPVQICQNRHQCCIACFQQIFGKQNSLCPFCRIQVPLVQVSRRKKQALQNRDKRKCHTTKFQLIQKKDKNSGLTQRQKNAMNWREYRKIRQVQGFSHAFQFLKKQIEQEDLNSRKDQSSIKDKPISQRATNDEEFIGLGSKHQQQLFIEKLGYDWYQRRYNLAELSLYDQLAVALLIENHQQWHFRWYETMLRKNPSNFKAAFGLAHCFRKPQSEKVIFTSPYQKVIALKPEFDKPYEIIAFRHLEMNAISEAFKFATECLKRNPNNIFAEFILVVCYSHLTSFQKQQRLLKIIEKEPTFIRAQHAFGKQLSNIGKHKQAIECYEKCLQTNQHYVCPIIDWAVSLIKKSENKAAIELLQKWHFQLKKKDNLSQDYKYYLGVAYQNMGDLQKAVKSYDQVQNYRDITADRLGNLYFKLQNWYRALIYYKKIRAGQLNVKLISKAVQCCEQQKLYKEEIQWLNKWYSLEPSNFELLFKLVNCYLKDKCYVGCISWCKKTIEKNVRPQAIYPIIIEALYNNKEHNQSLAYIEEYRRRYRLSPQQAEWLLNMEMKSFYSIQQHLRISSIKDK